jgi:hypothetical protein
MTNLQLLLTIGIPSLLVLVNIAVGTWAIKELRREIKDLRSEMLANHESLRREMFVNKESLRGEMLANNDSLRGEMKDNNESLRREMFVNSESLRSEMRDFRHEMLQRLDRVDADLRTFHSITGKLDGRLEAVERG